MIRATTALALRRAGTTSSSAAPSSALGPRGSWWTRRAELSRRLRELGHVANPAGSGTYAGPGSSIATRQVASPAGPEGEVRISRGPGNSAALPLWPDASWRTIEGTGPHTAEVMDPQVLDVNWSLVAMGVAPSPNFGGAVRNAPASVLAVRARGAEFTVSGPGRCLTARVAGGGVAARAAPHAVQPAQGAVPAEGEDEVAPEAPDAADYALNVTPATGYSHPTAWVPARPVAAIDATVPARRFERLAERCRDAIHADSPDGTFLRDASLGAGINVRVVSDSVAVDAFLANALPQVSRAEGRRGPAEILAEAAARGDAGAPDRVDSLGHKVIRDWPFHAEVIAASRLNLPRPARYSLADGARRFAATDFAGRVSVVAGGASGNDVATAVGAIWSHLAGRHGDTAVFDADSFAAGGADADGAVVVSGLAASPAAAAAVRATLPDASVLGGGPHAFTAAAAGGDAVAAAAFASSPVEVAGGAGAAAAAGLLAEGAFAETDGELTRVVRPAPNADPDAALTPRAVVFCTTDAAVPLVSRIDAAAAADRFAVGPSAADAASSSCYRVGLSSTAPVPACGVKAARATLAAALESSGTPAFLVNVGGDPAHAAAAIRALVQGDAVAASANWDKNAAFGVLCPKELDGVSAKALKGEAKAKAKALGDSIAKALKDLGCK